MLVLIKIKSVLSSCFLSTSEVVVSAMLSRPNGQNYAISIKLLMCGHNSADCFFLLFVERDNTLQSPQSTSHSRINVIL